MNHASSPSPDVRPWYREIWPWVVFGLPVLAVIAGMITVVLAVRHADPVVMDDWYREGRAYNRHLGLDRQAERFGLGARLAQDGQDVRLHLDSRVRLPWPEALTLYLRHPTLAERDLRMEFRRQPGGDYVAKGRTLPGGEWHLTLSGNNWRLVERLLIVAGRPVQLGIPAP